MKRRRGLSDDDKKLWDSVARQTEPLAKKRPSAPDLIPAKPSKPLPKTAKADKAAPVVKPFAVGSKVDHHGTHDLLPSLTEQMGRASIQMDRKTHGKMKRGKLSPEGRLDLHGMTLAEAHPELIHFILTSHSAGKRLVLVITGKGKDRDTGGPIPTRFGVLRHQVPIWLSRPPLGPVVLQVSQASLRHGGTGAYYVYLRRK